MGMSGRLLRPRNAFTPRSIANLAVWFDATNTASLTFNSTTVSQWNDLSGNGYHATQSTGANQPTYLATGMNSKPALEFTSSASNLLNSTATIANVFATPTTSPAATIFAVMRNPSGVTNSVFGTNSDTNGRLGYFSRFSSTTTFFDIVNTTDGRLSITTSQSEAEAVAIHTLFRSGATQTARYNGSQKATKSNATSNFTTTTATIQIGKGLSSGNAAIFSELVFYARALTTTEISAVERYLASKYGITLA